jgi:hypothetical protein
MNTANSFSALHATTADWRESLEDLLHMLQNDKPAHDNAALVGQIEDDITLALADLDHIGEIVTRSEQLWLAGNQAQVAAQLAQAHGLLADVVAHMGSRAASPLRLQHITLIVQQRGPQWSGWSQVVMRSLSGWSVFAAETLKKFSDIWQQIATPAHSDDAVPHGPSAGNFPTIHQPN